MSRFVKKLVRRNTTASDHRISSHPHSHSHSHSLSSSPGDDALKALLDNEIHSFCDAAKWNREGDEYLHLPTIVESAESSPSAARHAARTIRRILSKSLTPAGATHPNKPYNAIMIMRILTSNPGPTFTAGFDDKFAGTVKKVLKECKDVMVQHILRETLCWMEREVMGADVNVRPLVEVWEKERKVNAMLPTPQPNYTTHPRHNRTQSTPVTSSTINHSPRAPFVPTLPPLPPLPTAAAAPKPIHPITLPPPDDLAARISEANETAHLLQQFIQSTPASQFHTSELLLEFSARCQAAAQDIQSYIHATKPEPPDERTVLVLIETVEELAVALSRYNRAAVTARRICSVPTDEEEAGEVGGGGGGAGDRDRDRDPGVGPSGLQGYNSDLANAYQAEYSDTDANMDMRLPGGGHQPVNPPAPAPAPAPAPYTRTVPVSGPYLLPLERSTSSSTSRRHQQQQLQQLQKSQSQRSPQSHFLQPQRQQQAFDQESFYSTSQPETSVTPAPASAPPVPLYYRQQQQEQQQQQQQQQNGIPPIPTLHERSRSDTPPATATGSRSISSTNPFRRSTPMDSNTSLSRLGLPSASAVSGMSGFYTPSSMVVNLHDNSSYNMIPPPLAPSSTRLASSTTREGNDGGVSEQLAHTRISSAATTAATAGSSMVGNLSGNTAPSSTVVDDPEAELEWFYRRYSGDDETSSTEFVSGSPVVKEECRSVAAAVGAAAPAPASAGEAGRARERTGAHGAGHSRNRLGSGGSISVNVNGVDMSADTAARLLGTQNQRGGVVFGRDDEEEEDVEIQTETGGGEFYRPGGRGQEKEDYTRDYPSSNPFLRNAEQHRQHQLFGPLNSNPPSTSNGPTPPPTAAPPPTSPPPPIPCPPRTPPPPRSRSRSHSRRQRPRPRAQPLHLPKPRLASTEIEGSDGTVPFSDYSSPSHSSSRSELPPTSAPAPGHAPATNGNGAANGRSRLENGRYRLENDTDDDGEESGSGSESERVRQQQQQRWQHTAWSSPPRRQGEDSDRGLYDDTTDSEDARARAHGRNGGGTRQQKQQTQARALAAAARQPGTGTGGTGGGNGGGEGVGRSRSFRERTMGINPFMRKGSQKGKV